MIPFRLKLGPRLSAVSWIFIECFALAVVFFLPFSKSAAELCVTVGLVLWLLRKFPWNERFPRVGICNAAYMVLLTAALLSFTGLHGLFKWLQYLGIFFMGVELFQKPERVRRFLLVFLASMTLECADAFYQIWAGADAVKGHPFEVPGRFLRVSGSLGSPNGLAAFLLFALPLAFVLWLKNEKWSPKSLAYCLVLIIFGVVFILTLSRGAFFGLLFSIVVYALFQRKKEILILSLAGPLTLVLSKTLRENFFTSLNLKDITIGERFQFWKMALEAIREHPFLGNGVNAFYEKHGFHVHNGYLEIGSDIGLLGLLAFLAPLSLSLGRTLFAPDPQGPFFHLKEALLVALTAFLIQSFFDTNLQALQTSILFWMFWSMFVSVKLATR